MSTPNDAMRFLSRVAPAGTARAVVWDVRRNGPIATPSLAPSGAMGAKATVRSVPAAPAAPVPDGRGLARWRRAAALHRDDDVARYGVVSLVGHGTVAGERRRVVLPLLSSLTAPSTLGSLITGGGPTITEMGVVLGLDEEDLRACAKAQPGAGAVAHAMLVRMRRINAVIAALAARGTVVDRVVVGGAGNVLDAEELWLVLGELRYLELPRAAAPSVERLEAWSVRALDGTAFAALYGEDEAGADGHDATLSPAVDEPRSPLPLTRAQAAAVLAARDARVSVVSGAPGTGKSHTAIAIALDAVRRGGSVLLATRSPHAAEVLTDLLRRADGPTPVRFGGERSRRVVAGELAEGLPAAASRAELRRAEAAVEEAAAALRDADDVLAALLEVGRPSGGSTTDVLLRTTAPGAFAGDATPGELGRLVARASRTDGPFGTLRAGRALRRLRAACGADGDVPLARLRAAVDRARVGRLAAALDAAGGLDVAEARAAHRLASDALRAAVGHHLHVATRGAPDAAGRRAVAGLAAALRTGVQRRAEALARLDGAALTGALPLWVGTVGEVEQLLPAWPAMFDLVIVDEASQLDQLAAAPVLARGARVVVIGDPRQLRHVSFVADVEVDAALAAAELGTLAGRLDVRRVSTFDAAAAVAPVRWLDEHLRSVPHLIGFSARRFYDQHLHVATQHPRVDAHDAIDTVHVQGVAVDGVVAAEVEAALVIVDEHAAAVAAAPLSSGAGPGPSVGVVTPFRRQADAIEAAVLDRYDLEVIEALRLRVGTVHAFQGGERDVVVAALGLTADDPSQRRRFAEDPNLLNVLVTRARHRLVVVTALPPGTDGLIGAYLDHAERPPTPPPASASDDRWTAALAVELARLGHVVASGYGVGRFSVDLVVGEGAAAVALLTRPLDDVREDVARHEALHRAGWRIVESYATLTDDDPVARAIALGHVLPRRG